MARTPDRGQVKIRHQIRLTPVCWERLKAIASTLKLRSRAEAIEHVARDYVPLSEEAIARYDAVAEKLDKSRSQVLEELGRLDEEVLIHLLTQEQDTKADALLRFCSKVDKKKI